jgi:soluble lytic murein transglycosylase-like protein
VPPTRGSAPFNAATFSATTAIPSPDRQSPDRRRAAHRRFSTTTGKGNTVVSATAALGAVVTGGLLASQTTGTMALAGASENSQADRAMTAASAITPLQLQPASNDMALSASDMADTNAVTAILPIAGARDASADQRDVEALHKGEELATQAASLHAQSVKTANILSGGGNLDDWISVALSKLGLDQSLASGVKAVIMRESRGNPHAINRTDSNAMAGRPSQGLMQVIPSTFRAYVLPELAGRPITDPVANITAGIRYMLANYGMSTLRAGGRYSGGHYVGY